MELENHFHYQEGADYTPLPPVTQQPDTLRIEMQRMQGTQNPDLTVPPTHFGMAFLMCYFCCLPLGIYALAESNSVYIAIQNGDFEEAHRRSKHVKKIIWAGCLL
eukprot:TCONS_00033268-protein